MGGGGAGDEASEIEHYVADWHNLLYWAIV